MVAERGLEVIDLPPLRDDAPSGPAGDVSERVFETPAPLAGVARYGGVEVDGGYAVFRLAKVEPGDPASVDDAVRERIRQTLLRRSGYDFYIGYRDGLRDRAEVTIYEDQL